jgi:hypothetical protein
VKPFGEVKDSPREQLCAGVNEKTGDRGSAVRRCRRPPFGSGSGQAIRSRTGDSWGRRRRTDSFHRAGSGDRGRLGEHEA